MEINLDQFRSIFFEEAAEHLGNMEAGLLQLESSPHDLELLHSVFRGAHSIKGGSGMYNLADITRFTHAMESLLDVLRDGSMAVTPALTDLLLRSTDILRALVAIAQDGGQVPETLEATLQELQQALNQEPTPGTQAESSAEPHPLPSDPHSMYRVVFKPGRDLYRQGMEPLLILRDLGEIGTVSDFHADVSQLPDLADMDPESCYLAWSLVVKTDKSQSDIREIFAFVEDISEIIIERQESRKKKRATGKKRKAPNTEQGSGGGGQGSVEKKAAKKAQELQQESVMTPPSPSDPRPLTPDPVGGGRSGGGESASIRVSTEKVDKLINLVGELVITQSMISQTLQHFSPDKLNHLRESIAELERNTRELQERVMAVRMMPIGTSFSRFPRLVRDLAAKLDKQITVQMLGEETELDKGVIERIGDPLTHLVRNSADHGVELPTERLAAGKPEAGVIRLQAYHQGGNVIIEVADDGHGLNTERIKQKALQQGLIHAEDTLSDEQIHALIFHPGFSTASSVSDVSGRGVGMDVVKKNIEALNGSVSILSEAGKGSCFRIKLPLTLAIIDGLLLNVGSEVYVMPLLAIVESIRPRPEQVKSVFGRGEVIIVREEFLPLIRLHQLFSIPTPVSDPSKGLVVIVENEGKKFGLLVDDLLGQSQVVIKNLETNYRRVEGIVGATIMGDGRVALILDVQGVTRLALQASGGLLGVWNTELSGNGESALQEMDAEMGLAA